MYYVYILKSISHDQTYVGYTKNLKSRFADHNYGRSKHTSKYKPWELASYYAFSSESKARSFEEYLKTGSGIAFMKKHLI